MKTQVAMVVCVLVVCETGFNGAVFGAEDRPAQVRDPAAFWGRKTVFQKRGIVIEDDDFIVRERYWVLDQSVVGQVVNVEPTDGEKVFLEVEFKKRGGGWNQKGVNIRDRRVSRTNRNVTIRPEPYGDGARIETDEMTFSYRIEGEEVDPDRCGVIVRQEGDITVVRFPGHLLSLELPRKGDIVVRSNDWHDGFCDGGATPEGPHEGSAGDCIGTVEKERDREGFVVVHWEKTGRKTAHRFDHFGYYDIEKVP